MNTEKSNTNMTPSVSSPQWRILNPNRPAGMPPLVPVHLFLNEEKKDEPKPNPDKAAGAYYYNWNTKPNDNERLSVQYRLIKK